MSNETPLFDIDINVADPVADWHVPPESQNISSSSAEERWFRGLGWIFLCVGFSTFLISIKSVQDKNLLSVSLLQAILLVGMSQAVLIYLYRRKSNAIDVGTGLARVSAKVPENVDLLVDFEMYQQGTLIGKDRGYFWLESGTWFFKGMATAFRINQQDVVPIEAWPKKIRPDPDNDRAPTRFPLSPANAQRELRIRVVSPYEDYTKRRHAKEFYRQMYDWLVARPRDGIESLLPPRSVHPTMKAPLSLLHGGVVAGLLMFTADLAMVMGAVRTAKEGWVQGYLGVAVVALCGFCAGSLWLSARELHDGSIRLRLKKNS